MAHLQDVTVGSIQPLDAIRYAGNLSRADALLLAHYASTAMRILEFGAGGSTQILPQAAIPEAAIVSLDTKLQWIERTRKLCAKLGITREIRYSLYSTCNLKRLARLIWRLSMDTASTGWNLPARSGRCCRLAGYSCFTIPVACGMSIM